MSPLVPSRYYGQSLCLPGFKEKLIPAATQQEIGNFVPAGLGWYAITRAPSAGVIGVSVTASPRISHLLNTSEM